MRWPWKHRQRGGVSEARAVREESERRLREAEEKVKRPLRDMRKRNHVAAELVQLIRDRARGGEA